MKKAISIFAIATLLIVGVLSVYQNAYAAPPSCLSLITNCLYIFDGVATVKQGPAVYCEFEEPPPGFWGPIDCE